MENKSTAQALVLVATADQARCDSLTAALQKSGFETLTAYSSYSAAHVLHQHEVDAVVVDGEIVSTDPESRRRAILAAYSRLRFVVTHAALLSDAGARELNALHRGRLLDGADLHMVIRDVQELLASDDS